jgi:hypothetical protein
MCRLKPVATSQQTIYLKCISSFHLRQRLPFLPYQVLRPTMIESYLPLACCMICHITLLDLIITVTSSDTQVRGFKPGRSSRIFKGGKILSTPSFGREVKPWLPCRRSAACKRILNVPWKSSFRQNYRSLVPPISSNFRR